MPSLLHTQRRVPSWLVAGEDAGSNGDGVGARGGVMEHGQAVGGNKGRQAGMAGGRQVVWVRLAPPESIFVKVKGMSSSSTDGPVP
ncbi:hypothetical protein E2C01_050850 [Portunus trituberculatus]|uniref:Uncharacterized protein n=1 Tax=Portunus trituberculatus TaxID=210409 RepID=A0A5B7GK26_PORTR|nr:hypothetical protein [Portunus trituberculatus]